MGAPWVIYQIKTRFGKTITDIYQFRTVRERNLFQHHYITHHSSPLITILLISSTPPSSSQSVSLARSLMNTFLAESVRDIVVKGTISDKKVILRFSFKVKSFFLIGNCKKKNSSNSGIVKIPISDKEVSLRTWFFLYLSSPDVTLLRKSNA